MAAQYRVGVTTAIFALHVVLGSGSLRRVWCHGHSHCTVCGSQSPSLCCMWCHGHGRLCHMWVAVAVFAPCGCCSHCLCTMCGIAAMVVAPHVVLQPQSLCHVWVTIAVVAPHVVSWLWLSQLTTFIQVVRTTKDLSRR
jgi:hypothetical protein